MWCSSIWREPAPPGCDGAGPLSAVSVNVVVARSWLKQLAGEKAVQEWRIRRMGGVLRERAGAERSRRAAEGGRPIGAPGRWRGRAVPLGYTPAQAVLPGGGRQGRWASWLS